MSTTNSITVALSTVFTPPISCLTSWTYEPQSYNQVTSGILLQNALPGYVDTECFPPGFSQAGRVFQGQVFSPGACPYGYTTHSPIQVSGSITTATCCSSDFSYYSSSYQGCLSVWSGTTSLIVRTGGFTAPNTIAGTLISGTFTMWALPVTVELQASDRSLYTTITSTLTASISPASTSMSISTTPTSVSTTSVWTSSSAAISEPQSSGLSTGTKAGISVGAVAGALVAIGVGLLFIRKYQRSRKAGLVEMAPCHNHTVEELESIEAKKPTAELNANSPQPPELQS